jgi:hypothetical protein
MPVDPLEHQISDLQVVLVLKHHVAAAAQNDRDERVDYCGKRARYDAEIEAYLRADHWQNEKDANPVGFQASQRARDSVGKQPHDDPSAVERWQRQQIEDRQNDVDDQRILQIFSSPLRGCVWQVVGEAEQERGGRGEYNIDAGPAAATNTMSRRRLWSARS